MALLKENWRKELNRTTHALSWANGPFLFTIGRKGENMGTRAMSLEIDMIRNEQVAEITGEYELAGLSLPTR